MTGDETYTPALAAEILLRLSHGEFLRRICDDPTLAERHGHGVAASTVCSWVVDDVNGFAERYARARTVGFDQIAEDLVDIADDNGGDERVVLRNGKRVTIVDHDHINRARVRVDTRKWLLSKWHPEKFGERKAVDLNVKDDEVSRRLVEARQRVGSGK